MITTLLIVCAIGLVTANPEVTLKQGKLKGVEDKTWNGRTFDAFTKVPYAEPPVGDLRFKPPVSKKPWEGVLDASQPTPMCTQIDLIFGDYTAKGVEDCLYLNVYTPKVEQQEPLPVLLFIHGGGFMMGMSSWYGPRILLDKDVVYVTINYRLGALGFLSTGDLVVPGNNGLKDQSFAIKWVKENIAHFGGDPTKITIFGQSAGGASVHYHMLSPLSKDLIHGVISQSGTAVAGWALDTEQNVRNTKRLAKMLDCPIESSQKIIDCLRGIDALKIGDQDSKFFEWSYDPSIIFKPVIEPEHEGAFLPEHPVDIIKSGKAADVPYIVGVTSEDGAFKSANIYNDSKLIKQLDEEFNTIAPITLFYKDYVENSDEISAKVRKFYFGDNHIDDSTKSEVTNMYTDFWFLANAESAARLHAKFNKKPTFYYVFNFRGTTSLAKVLGDPLHDYGVCHGDDLLYLVSMELFFPNYKPNADEQIITEKMVAMWVNFAKTGNPTPENDSEFPVKWQPVQSDKVEYYLIKGGSAMAMKSGLYKERLDFYKSLPIGGMKKKIDEQF